MEYALPFKYTVMVVHLPGKGNKFRFFAQVSENHCFHSNSNLTNISVPAVINLLNLMYCLHTKRTCPHNESSMEAMLGITKKHTTV